LSRIAETLGVSRPHLSSSSEARGRPSQDTQPEATPSRAKDLDLLQRIRDVIAERPSNGYRRVTARLNRQTLENCVNHKRVYRVMREARLLLPRFGKRSERAHDGKVMTLASDMRWCSDGFEIRCWNGDKVHVAFSLDCCDREAIAWVAKSAHLDGCDMRNLIALTVEARFAATRVPKPIEWLTDNGPPYVAYETRSFAAACGLLVRNTPAYSPESNGMAEAFVKTFKRDYVYLAQLTDANTVLALLPAWFADYNETHPHKALNMLSPRQFRRRDSA
jgi:putative transposase